MSSGALGPPLCRELRCYFFGRSFAQDMNLSARRTLTAVGLGTTAIGLSLTTAAPATAGGIGDFLSPAFGTNCANHHTRPHATGATTAGTGTADGNLLGVPVGSALNQCGGADMIGAGFVSNIGAIAPIGSEGKILNEVGGNTPQQVVDNLANS